MTSPSDRETGGSAGLEAPPAEFETLPAGIDLPAGIGEPFFIDFTPDEPVDNEPVDTGEGPKPIRSHDLYDFFGGRPWGQTQEARFDLVRGTSLNPGAIWRESELLLLFGGKYLRFRPA